MDSLAAAFAHLSLRTDSGESPSDSASSTENSVDEDDISITEELASTVGADAASILTQLEAEQQILSTSLDPSIFTPSVLDLADGTICVLLRFQQFCDISALPCTEPANEGQRSNPSEVHSWAICSVSLAPEDATSLIVTRFQHGHAPLVARVDLISAPTPAAAGAHAAAPAKKAAAKRTAVSAKVPKAKQAAAAVASVVPAQTNHLLLLRKQLEGIIAENTDMLKERGEQNSKTKSSSNIGFLSSSRSAGVDNAANNKEFWQRRTDLDDRVRELCNALEDKILGWRKIFLLGAVAGWSFATGEVSGILADIGADMLSLIVSGSEFLSDEELISAILWASGADGADVEAVAEAALQVRTLFEQEAESGRVEMSPALSFVTRGANVVQKETQRPMRCPVVLILDKSTIALRLLRFS